MRKTFVLISKAASPSVLMEQCGLACMSLSSKPCGVLPLGEAIWRAEPFAGAGPGAATTGAGGGANGGASAAMRLPPTLLLPVAPSTLSGEDDGFEGEAVGRLPTGEPDSCIAPSVMSFGAGRRRAWDDRSEGLVI